MPRRTAAEAAETRRDLIAAARALFAEDGYEAVSAEAIARRAGVTRGALYHHFAEGKAAVFEAAYREALADFDRQVQTAGIEVAAETGDLWAAFWAGTDRHLELCCDRAFVRLVLYDAPVALGVERWEAIDAEFSVGQLVEILGLLMAEGLMPPQPVEPLARALVGAYNVVARQIAMADDQQAALEEYGGALRTIVRGLASATD